MKITFWITTGLIFLLQGIMPILTYNDPGTMEAMAHLGYPAYFGLMLAIFKFSGGLALIIPQVPAKVKEWAYAGYGLDFIAALYSFIAVDGLGTFAIFPIIAFAMLTASYISYHKVYAPKQ